MERNLGEEGLLNQVKGKAKEIKGVFTDSTADTLKGKAQGALGKAQVEIHKTAEDAKRRV